MGLRHRGRSLLLSSFLHSLGPNPVLFVSTSAFSSYMIGIQLACLGCGSGFEVLVNKSKAASLISTPQYLCTECRACLTKHMIVQGAFSELREHIFVHQMRKKMASF